MTKVFTDTSTALAEASLNKMLAGDCYTNGIYAAVAYRIAYDGANWGVSTTIGSTASASEVTAVWNAGDNRLDVSLSALDNQFTAVPAVFVSAEAAAAHASQPRFQPQATATSVTAIQVRFVSLASATDYQTAESTKMAFNILIYGKIV